MLFIFFFLNADAQVYNGDLTLSTQEQVDAFNYQKVTGTLTISGYVITNVNGLSELKEVGDKLYIDNNLELTNIDGLHNLEKVSGTVFIKFNDALRNLNGLSKLASAYGLVISGNYVLSNLNGLSILETLAFSGCRIEENAALTSVVMPSLKSISGSLFIQKNTLLSSIQFPVLTLIGDLLEIVSNPSLTTMNFPKLKETGAGLTISKNTSLPGIDGLKALETVGYMKITSSNFANIDALSNVHTLVGLEIALNPSLVNLDGLSGVTEIFDYVSIFQNNALVNIDGLSNVKSIHGKVTISSNAGLTEIDGLSSVKEMLKSLTIDHNFQLVNLDGLSSLLKLNQDLTITGNTSLVDFCGLYPLFQTGTIGGTITIKFNGANTVALIPPPNITVNADQGLCWATVPVTGTATAQGCLKPGVPVRSIPPTGNIYVVGTNTIVWTVTDAGGNTAMATQKVVVVDNQKPVITCPANLTVSCASDVPAININSVLATDNCSALVEHVSDVISNRTCSNRFTLTRTYKATDPSGNFATCSQVITVYDNVPPQITGVSVSQQALWPPNHTMQDVTLNYAVNDNCVQSPVTTVSISSNEPVNGTGDGDTAPDWEVVDAHHIRLRAERAGKGNGRIYTITVTANDGCNPVVTAATTVSVSHDNSVTQARNMGVLPELVKVEGAGSLQINVAPNPAPNNFAIKVNSDDKNGKIVLQILDAMGRVVETKTVQPSALLRIGENYKPGPYILRTVQGNVVKEVKLIKLYR